MGSTTAAARPFAHSSCALLSLAVLPWRQLDVLLRAERLQPLGISFQSEDEAVLLAVGDPEVLHFDIERLQPLLGAGHLQTQLGQLLVLVFHAADVVFDLGAKRLVSL